jgi:hypothetical protein
MHSQGSFTASRGKSCDQTLAGSFEEGSIAMRCMPSTPHLCSRWQAASLDLPLCPAEGVKTHVLTRSLSEASRYHDSFLQVVDQHIAMENQNTPLYSPLPIQFTMKPPIREGTMDLILTGNQMMTFRGFIRS